MLTECVQEANTLKKVATCDWHLHTQGYQVLTVYECVCTHEYGASGAQKQVGMGLFGSEVQGYCEPQMGAGNQTQSHGRASGTEPHSPLSSL